MTVVRRDLSRRPQYSESVRGTLSASGTGSGLGGPAEIAVRHGAAARFGIFG